SVLATCGTSRNLAPARRQLDALRNTLRSRVRISSLDLSSSFLQRSDGGLASRSPAQKGSKRSTPTNRSRLRGSGTKPLRRVYEEMPKLAMRRYSRACCANHTLMRSSGTPQRKRELVRGLSSIIAVESNRSIPLNCAELDQRKY